MTIPDAEHLFEQAERLIAPRPGAARQVDLRRAVSGAYYGLFHAVLAAAADEVIGATKRASVEYGLAYRSIAHRALNELCVEVAKPTLSARYRAHEPESGFGFEMKAFAANLVELQFDRYQADYNPRVRLERSDAIAAIAAARGALHRFRRSPTSHRTRFLALLLFPPR